MELQNLERTLRVDRSYKLLIEFRQRVPSEDTTVHHRILLMLSSALLLSACLGSGSKPQAAGEPQLDAQASAEQSAAQPQAAASDTNVEQVVTNKGSILIRYRMDTDSKGYVAVRLDRSSGTIWWLNDRTRQAH